MCEIAQIPPYVLRSWEKEFPGLGAAARPGGPRIYRRSDVEQILRIKQLVFAEGLTLAGVRHRIEGEPRDEEEALIEAACRAGRGAGRRAEPRRRGAAGAACAARAAVGAACRRRRCAGGGGRPPAESRAAVEEPAASPAVHAAREPESPRLRRTDLPLLNGVLDTPPKPRRGRRHGQTGAVGPAK